MPFLTDLMQLFCKKIFLSGNTRFLILAPLEAQPLSYSRSHLYQIRVIPFVPPALLVPPTLLVLLGSSS